MLFPKWQETYHVALLETDTSKLAPLIEAARQAIFRETQEREIPAKEYWKMQDALRVLTLLEGNSPKRQSRINCNVISRL